MTTNTPWTPSLKWHAKLVAILLGLCLAAYGFFCYITEKLPPPYQKHRPAAEATPWMNHSQEDL